MRLIAGLVVLSVLVAVDCQERPGAPDLPSAGTPAYLIHVSGVSERSLDGVEVVTGDNGALMAQLRVTVGDLWYEVDRDGLILRWHAVQRDENGIAVQENYYEDGGSLVTRTIYDTDQPAYSAVDPHFTPFDFTYAKELAALERRAASAEWAEVPAGEGQRKFERRAGVRVDRVVHDVETGRVVEDSLHKLGPEQTEILVERSTRDIFEVIDLGRNTAPPGIWDPAL